MKTSQLFQRLLLSIMTACLFLTACNTSPETNGKTGKVNLRLKLAGGEFVDITTEHKAVFTIKIAEQLLGIAIGEANSKDETEIRLLQAAKVDSSTMTVAKDQIVELEKIVLPLQGADSQYVITKAGFQIISINDEIARRPLGGSPNRCCVSCGNTTACGCAVTMSCGSCCAGVCCTKDGHLPTFLYQIGI